MLKIRSIPVSVMATNCYVITDEATNKSAIIDPGKLTNGLKNLIAECGIDSFEYIMFTHGHFDHIDGVNDVKELYGGKTVISKQDEICFQKPEFSLSQKHFALMNYPKNADITVADGDELMLGESKIKVMLTPGHTTGCVCFICDDVIFSGDTLFAGSCGRTDFVGGNAEDMYNSLQALAALEGDYTVYPGHGRATTLETERKTNGYIRL